MIDNITITWPQGIKENNFEYVWVDENEKEFHRDSFFCVTPSNLEKVKFELKGNISKSIVKELVTVTINFDR